VRPAVISGQARYLSPLPATQSLRLDVVLPLRNQAGLDRFLQMLYDPSSPSYRHFLTVAEFTARFGPTEEDYGAVARYAKSYGFQVVGGSRDGMDLQIEGPVAAIEAAFNVRMGVYQHPIENRTFYAPDREPAVGLPFPLWHVSGLDNYSIPHPMLARKSDYANAPGVEPGTVSSSATTGSGPSGSFLGSDMRAAYYGGTALTGAGQNLGLLEYYGTDLADLTTYFQNVGQTNNVPITLLSTDGTSTSCTEAPTKCDDTEQTIDMTQALGMAPGLASLVMYIGSTDTAILSAMTTYTPLPNTIGCSWGWQPVDPGTLDPYFERMAAQGQNFFAASGDYSTWSTDYDFWPSDSAFVVSVGGTDLTTASAAGPWASETAWKDSGGGISPNNIPIPGWQQIPGVINTSNNGSNTYRNGPDVSANADFTYYVCADQAACTANKYGGTSFAAPMWAGYMALVNQQASLNGNAPLGFINPAIYSFGAGSTYSTDFHDIVSGLSGSYSAVPGYDLVTGWGSPNGTGLIDALADIPASAAFTISASPSSVSVAPGGSGTTTITTAVSGGFNSAIALSAAVQRAGVSVSFSPPSIAAPGSGTSTMTMAVASTTAVGSYAITVSGTGASTMEPTSTVILTVTPAPALAISASPSSVSVAPGASGTSTITTALSGSFNAAIALSASGLPPGTTAAFSPASISAPGSGTSTMTLKVGALTVVGTYTVTVTGTGGGLTNTTAVTLTVTAPGFTISASPASVPVAESTSGTSTVTTAAVGGFNSPIALSATGQPAGVTVSFSPAAIAAPGSGASTMTMGVASTTAPGSYTITVTGTGGNIIHSSTVILTVTTTLTITTAALPNGQTGVPYSAVLTAVGGTTPYTWSAPRRLPNGLILNAQTGQISGTPTVSVTNTPLIFNVTDSTAPTPETASVNLTLTITSAGTLTITTASLPNGQTGAPYSAVLTAAGGTTPYTWALTSGTLPAGLTLNAQSGLIAGTPATSVTNTPLTFKVTDSTTPTPQSATVSLTLTIASAATLTIATASLPNGQTGVPYSAVLTAAGGTTPYTWSLTSGTLPAGLTLNPQSGLIAGTPAVSLTNTPLTFKVTDSTTPTPQSATVSLTLTIAPSATLTIATASLPNGQTGVPYSAVLTATGGTTPYTWTVTPRRMPAGLTLNAQTGQISGTPTVSLTNTLVTFTVTDSTSPTPQSATVSLTLTVSSTTLTITTSSLPNGQIGSPYSAVLMAVGGTTPYTWALTSGTLPAGLTLNAQTGQISGTPAVSVTNTPLTVKVTDSTAPAPQSATVSLTLTVASATLTITTVSLPNGQTGVPYAAVLTAVGGTAPYTWALTSGRMPAGLALNPLTGQISGTPAGSVTNALLTFNVTDSTIPTAQTATISLVLTITATM
jgi:kumamolisin